MWVFIAIGLIVCGVDSQGGWCEDGPRRQCMSCCAGADHATAREILLSSFRCLLRSLLGYATNWIPLWYSLKLDTGSVGCFCNLLGETLVQSNFRLCMWLVLGNVFVIHSLWLPPRPGCAREGLSFSPRLTFTGTGPSVQKETQDSPWPVCAYMLGLVTGRASGSSQVAWGRFSVSHQVGASGVHEIDTGSNSVPVLVLVLRTLCSWHLLGAFMLMTPNCGAGSQGVWQSLSGPRTKIWLGEGRMFLLQPHNSVWPTSCPWRVLSREGPLAARRMGPAGLQCRGGGSQP